METIPSELQEEVALSLNLTDLAQLSLTSSKLLWLSRDLNFIERWILLHYPEFFSDYLQLKSLPINIFVIVRKLIKENEVFFYSVERLCLLAGRKADLNLYKYYINTLGYTQEAFTSFVDGLIDMNFRNDNSDQAKDILDYILTVNENDKRPDHTTSNSDPIYSLLYNPDYDDRITDEIKEEIKLKIKVHSYITSISNGKYDLTRIELNKSYIMMSRIAIEYLARFGVILTTPQLTLLFNEPFEEAFYYSILQGLLEGGFLDYIFKIYLPSVEQHLLYPDLIRNLSFEFENILILHYDRRIINIYLNLILQNHEYQFYYDQIYKILKCSDRQVLEYLLESPFYDIIINKIKVRDLERAGDRSHKSLLTKDGRLHLATLPTAFLAKKYPNKIKFDYHNFFHDFLNQMLLSMELGNPNYDETLTDELNPKVILKLIELYPELKLYLAKQLDETGQYEEDDDFEFLPYDETIHSLKKLAKYF